MPIIKNLRVACYRSRGVLLIPIICMLSACSSAHWVEVQKYNAALPEMTPASSAPVQWRERTKGQIAPGYLVGLKSPDAKINGNFRVDFDGSLRLPYNAVVKTSNLNEDQLRQTIRASYTKYFKSPADLQLSIVKKEYLVNAQGLVQKPGEYVVDEDSTLDEIIAKAGGLKEGSAVDNVARFVRISGPGGAGVIRLGDYYSGAKQLVPRWQGGETVFFQSEGGAALASREYRSNSVKVIGQVRNPAEYPVESNADFFTYLVKAGGPTDRADPGNIILIRADETRTRAMTFSMLDIKSIPQILPGDAIIFSADNASAFEKNTRIAGNLAGILTAVGVVIIAL